MWLVFGHTLQRTAFVALFVSTDPCIAICGHIGPCNMGAMEANYTANGCREGVAAETCSGDAHALW